jgi:hypothetical protein
MGLEQSALAAYSMTFAELVSRTYLMMDDPARERWEVVRVKEAINEAMLDIALDAQLIKETAIVQLTKGGIVYEVDLFASAQNKRPYASPLRVVYDLETNPALHPVSKQELDREPGFNWSIPEGGSGCSPTKWHSDIFQHGEIGIWPPSSGDGVAPPGLTGNLQVTYVAHPTPMVNDIDHPDTLPALYHEAIAVRAAGLLLDEGGEEDVVLAENLVQEAEMWITKIVGDSYRNMTHYNDVSPM